MLKRLLSESVSLVFGNLEVVFKTCGSWIVLQFVLMTSARLVVGSAGQQADPSVQAVFFSLAIMVFTLVSSASISVAWHRFGLLGDKPGLIHLKFSRIELSFVLKMLLLGLFVLGLWLVVLLVHNLILVPAFTIVFGLLLLFFAIPAFFRLSLILPATAVERPIGLGEAYSVSAGLGWYMFFASVILALPFALANLGIQYLLQAASGSIPLLFIQIKILILNVLLQIIVTVLGISVLTGGYRIAMERKTNGTGN
ncbi:hypothetical protein [Roseibium aggregatum]|uniref:Uncharacterized protein n=1 Tax=Roseibium aggregatum TaxID=187304 RepID=A0A939J6M5_9HYPH|nr:hypothetical protein [Roseibium aggregatum]MBN9673440.1 hypothetical protein [Roseibium aggregatum]